MAEIEVGPVAEMTPGTIKGVGRWAVGNIDGEYFAVTRTCRHFKADLAGGEISEDGCLVCPWHGAKYDVDSGYMMRGPQGIFARVPLLPTAFEAITRVFPLARAEVVVREGVVYVRD